MMARIRNFWRLLRSGDPRAKIRLEMRVGEQPVIGALYRGWRRLRGWLTQRTPEDYLAMQKRQYERYASADAVQPGEIEGDFVVGSWQEHDAWPDYEQYLMQKVSRAAGWLALEYGCGPGRNIRRWTDWFQRIDGVDISARNLENARIFLSKHLPLEKTPQLYVTDGQDCGAAPRDAYDFAFSTICLQHICVHAVRYAIFRSLFACLKPGGRLSVQMGFGVPSQNTVSYFENHNRATETNRLLDVAIGTADEPRGDLEKIGFREFEYWVRPVGPGDCHPQWIFFTAVKPVA